MSNNRIGIDVGGTKINMGVVDITTGQILTHIHFLKDQLNSDQVQTQINQHIIELSAPYPQLLPVGIAVPELVGRDGKIKSKDTYQWIGKENLFTGNPVHIESDVRAGALAELTYGAAQSSESAIYISLGTGLSYSFIQQGQVWPGHRGYAIHFTTSNLYFPTDPQIYGMAPAPFNFENEIAGKGFNRHLQLMFGPDFSTRSLFKNLTHGDQTALTIVQYHTDYLGALIAQLVNILDPEQIIIGGGFGLALKNSIYRDILQQKITQNIIAPECKQQMIIDWAHFEEFSGVIGAALSTVPI